MHRRRFYNALFLVLVLVGMTGATPQYDNYLVFEGKEYPIEQDPMESYFAQYPTKKPVPSETSSALWRGYVAYFEIRNKELFLKDIVITENGGRRQKSVLVQYFGDSSSLKIAWYSGLLVARYGKNSHPGPVESIEFRNYYESYAIFEIDRGVLTQDIFFDNKRFRAFHESQFTQFKKTPEFQTQLKKYISWGDTPEHAELKVGNSLFWNIAKIMKN